MIEYCKKDWSLRRESEVHQAPCICLKCHRAGQMRVSWHLSVGDKWWSHIVQVSACQFKLWVFSLFYQDLNQSNMSQWKWGDEVIHHKNYLWFSFIIFSSAGCFRSTLATPHQGRTAELHERGRSRARLSAWGEIFCPCQFVSLVRRALVLAGHPVYFVAPSRKR